ncbi:hypothetical protein D3C85_13450 [compost metagenome]
MSIESMKQRMKSKIASFEGDSIITVSPRTLDQLGAIVAEIKKLAGYNEADLTEEDFMVISQLIDTHTSATFDGDVVDNVLVPISEKEFGDVFKDLPMIVNYMPLTAIAISDITHHVLSELKQFKR